MRLRQFRGHAVHGYLEFFVSFNTDVTMLHGINGAGKTTAVRSIMALLTPDLAWLSSTQFDSLSVALEVNEQEFTVSARKEVENLFVSVSGSFNNFEEEIITRIPLRYADYINERKMMRRNSNPIEDDFERHLPPETDTSALNMIRSLPTPTFLGLERTTLPADYSNDEVLLNERGRRGHSSSRLLLEASTNEALRLAKAAYEDRYQRPRNALMNRLKSDIVLSLFEKNTSRGRISLPSESDLSGYAEMQNRITTVLRQIQLVSDVDIKKKVDPFFTELLGTGRNIARGISSPNTTEAKRTELILKWVELDAPLSSIEKVVKLAQDYDAADRSNFSLFDRYQITLNEFFEDSGKRLQINTTGNIEVLLPNGELGDVSQFSSGERQLFVLLTHLTFNKKTHEADVLIIDEPELSLHLKWQQRFVDAIVKTSPTTQVVLATHSPAIIGKFRKNCVSLNGKRRPTKLQ